MPRGVKKLRLPPTSGGTCFICGSPVQVFSYGKGGFAIAKCAKCRQRGSRSKEESMLAKKVEKALVKFHSRNGAAR